MTVRRMLNEMSAYELLEWQVYDEIEPIGTRRSDFQSASISATIANVLRGKGRKPHRDLTVFIPQYGRKRKTARQMLAHVEQINAIFGGKDLRGRAH